ncbi:zinc finger MYM-type protein 2-like [Mytilus trossulus]|uniref:zinc finger MYM-type protein 2-like n=1 Tax=Mytilus trossulus TaxID=6551 RepID=UPI003005D223
MSEEVQTVSFTSEEAKVILADFARTSYDSTFEIDYDFQELNYETDTGNEVRVDENPSSSMNDVNVNDSNNKENKRFSDVSLEDTDKFLVDTVNKNTLYKTRTDVKTFQDWLIEIGEARDFKEIPPKEMDGLLARFCLGVRKKDKTEYEPDSITAMMNSIERHFKDIKMPYSIKDDTLFSHSKRVLESKRKCLKVMGKGNKKLKADPLEKEEIEIMYEKNVLGAGNPESLLNTVWLNNGVYFGLRGRQDHSNMLWGDVELKMTSDGKEYLEFTEKSTKTRSGKNSGDCRKVLPKAFQVPEDDNCPIKIYKAYRDRRPLDMREPDSRFYLKPLNKPKSEIWYSRQCVGKNKMGTIMKDMASKCDLQGRKVNHSSRKTFGQTLLNGGRPLTEVADLGGWKSIESVKSYVTPSIKQQQMASDTISSMLIPST